MEKQTQNVTDETLVSLAQAGDKDAEQQLLVRYLNLVRFCARKFFLMGGETEDLIQEGMIGLCQAIDGYKCKEKGGQSFKNFAYLCIWRRIIDAVKVAASKKNAPLNNSVSVSDAELLFSNLDPEERVISDDDRRELNKMMSKQLSDIEFKVFTMYMDGASVSEICEMTGKSQKSVDNAVQRSKMKLRKVLADKNKTTEKE